MATPESPQDAPQGTRTEGPRRRGVGPRRPATQLVLLAASALLIAPAAQAQSFRDRVIHNQCSTKLTAELASKGITSPPPQFVETVCNCVVKSVDAGATIDQAKETCKAQVKAELQQKLQMMEQK